MAICSGVTATHSKMISARAAVSRKVASIFEQLQNERGLACGPRPPYLAAVGLLRATIAVERGRKPQRTKAGLVLGGFYGRNGPPIGDFSDWRG